MYKKNRIAAIIPAKKSNDNIAELNLKYLGEKPLITYTIKAASESDLIDKVFLSTEDTSVSKLAKQYDIDVPFLRPMELTKPSVTAKEVAIFMLNKINELFDVILILMPNAPFRDHDIIDSGIKFLVDNNLEKLRSVSKLRDYFIPDNHLENENENENDKRGNRKEFPNFSEKTVVAGGMYIYKFDRLFKHNDELEFEDFYIPRHESMLIKSLYDLLIAERLVNLNTNLINTLTDST